MLRIKRLKNKRFIEDQYYKTGQGLSLADDRRCNKQFSSKYIIAANHRRLSGTNISEYCCIILISFLNII